MMLPGLLLLLVFNYIPLIGLVIAFEDFHPYEGIFGSAWVGLQNFAYLFQTSIALNATRNTVMLNAVFIVTILIVSLAIAVSLNEIRDSVPWLSKFYQSVLFFPYFISYVLVGYFIFALLNADNGMVNHVASSLHAPQVNWYSSPQYWPVILTIVNISGKMWASGVSSTSPVSWASIPNTTKLPAWMVLIAGSNFARLPCPYFLH